ncbi:hypothetical protein EVAR_43949_1 [Eumeta japonica]|uniref:Uncharacterized protein n=1 Tax=Eumeta variegata TaxID=151549 RepID=A0A4C1XYD8_EUMVA|nr:hypothetical protein EVAR_43949_1 [Eumeta japonica]
METPPAAPDKITSDVGNTKTFRGAAVTGRHPPRAAGCTALGQCACALTVLAGQEPAAATAAADATQTPYRHRPVAAYKHTERTIEVVRWRQLNIEATRRGNGSPPPPAAVSACAYAAAPPTRKFTKKPPPRAPRAVVTVARSQLRPSSPSHTQ